MTTSEKLREQLKQAIVDEAIKNRLSEEPKEVVEWFERNSVGRSIRLKQVLSFIAAGWQKEQQVPQLVGSFERQTNAEEVARKRLDLFKKVTTTPLPEIQIVDEGEDIWEIAFEKDGRSCVMNAVEETVRYLKDGNIKGTILLQEDKDGVLHVERAFCRLIKYVAIGTKKWQ